MCPPHCLEVSKHTSIILYLQDVSFCKEYIEKKSKVWKSKEFCSNLGKRLYKSEEGYTKRSESSSEATQGFWHSSLVLLLRLHFRPAAFWHISVSMVLFISFLLVWSGLILPRLYIFIYIFHFVKNKCLSIFATYISSN